MLNAFVMLNYPLWYSELLLRLAWFPRDISPAVRDGNVWVQDLTTEPTILFYCHPPTP